ncbi:FAD:protein FMN transferase [Flavobacteriales bacterium]|nr:FAD:protein FMN transferase [Flavobacteriales bacterium]
MTLVSRLLLLIFFLLSLSCQDKISTFSILGYTQGTTYNIKYHSFNKQISKQSIDSLLRIIDLSMSNYIPSSTISKLNNNLVVSLDPLINYVISRSIEICYETDGMFDITVSPLVSDWGFGPDKKHQKPNTSNESLYEIGCDKIAVKNNILLKSDIVQIDLDGIAQGFSVDFVSNYLKSQSIDDFMIEIGGEVTCFGNNLGQGWKIGVDAPTDKNRSLGYILKLENLSLATSGNYRNYYYSDSIKISHTINPKTLRPSSNSLLSATVISSDCISADAYATACMAFGLQGAKDFMHQNNIVGSLVYEEGNDTVYYFSDTFSSFLHRSPASAPQ